ncbi:hypothetical protein [Mycolicibacterium komossense]|jgi:hypothetical protein|uniref:Secreted protein n=1 Tax=Mycolicibacterium komossense TaxID=1779 RepID=A0ABT3CG26_9MYCO|nr:hypothetical protein [Mycolicibacterium komossense]MCV7228429.1 hypothetical protein [Mycolicibacterium komossense]
MKKLAAAVMTTMALAAVPAAIAPAAHADVCADAGGRHVDVGGCTDIAGDAVAGAAVAGAAMAPPEDAAAQMAAGQPPCYTAEGVPYYTPGSDPCLP